LESGPNVGFGPFVSIDSRGGFRSFAADANVRPLN